MPDPALHDARAVAEENPAGAGEPFRLTFVHRTSRSTTVVAEIPAGGGLKPHIHREHDEIITFIAGEARFRLGERYEVVHAGQTISVPAGAVHGPVRSDAGCLLVAVYSPEFDPARPDRHVVDE